MSSSRIATQVPRSPGARQGSVSAPPARPRQRRCRVCGGPLTEPKERQARLHWICA
jgi:hypothetical protein